ncbi:unnamed protein product, partial [Sphagnum jensenii]
GGIGSAVLLYLAGSGVGNIHIVDFDKVELSNLHRQVIHDEVSINTPKVESAAKRLRQLNSSIQCTSINEALSSSNCMALVQRVDVVVDATDNVETRYLLSDACVLLGKPLVSGSAGTWQRYLYFHSYCVPVGLEGQVTVLCAHSKDGALGESRGPCYRCLYPSIARVAATRSCADAGILGPVAGVVGCFEAAEAIKVLLLMRAPEVSRPAVTPLINRQSFYDGSTGETHLFELCGRRADCVACGDSPSIVTAADSWADIERMRAQETCATAALPCLAPHTEVSVQDFYAALQQAAARSSSSASNRKNENKVVVLDVRSATQHAMVSLRYYLENISAGEESAPTEVRACVRDLYDEGKLTLIDLPLKRLLLLSGDALVSAIIRSASEPAEVGHKREWGEERDDTATVYVLCRRGVHSVLATRHLLEHTSLRAVNVRGGLTAWWTHVDHRFPSY